MPSFPTAGEIRPDVPLAPYTTWQAGGSARWLWSPAGVDEVPTALAHCAERGIPVHRLGRGSNVLVADGGVDGVVVCTRRTLQGISREGDTLVAEAGVPLPALSRYAAALGHGGFEFLVGIPGTVGGGVAMNAGLAAGGAREVAHLLVDAEVVSLQGEVRRVNAADLCLQHRASRLLDSGEFLLRARFALSEPAPAEEIRARMARHLSERRRKQPLGRATAGSTFKHPPGPHAAGWYVEQCGLKGHRVGGARVSPKHANWIENLGGARASEILALIEHVQEVVWTTFGVRLEREVELLPRDHAGEAG